MIKPLFYLHIPKTAGSSMNRFLCDQFKDDETALHIESTGILDGENALEQTDQFKLLSGHIPLPRIIQKLDVLKTRQTIATFRLPITHVISHISWVRKLGDPSEHKRLKVHTASIQKITAKLLETDLSKPAEITELIRWLEANKLFLFNNTQTQYLCGGALGGFSPQLINQALQHLNQIDYVGTVERLNEFLLLLCYRLGFTQANESSPIKKNTNPETYGLDIKDESIRRALQPLIGWDQIIYRHARERFIDDVHHFLAELEKSKSPHYISVRNNLILS